MKRLSRLLWIGAIAVAALVACGRGEPVSSPRGFSPSPTRGYLLISIDTLRSDHLGSYGYSLPTSPFLDELAARATLFEHVVAPYPATLPSHMSIFTGLYPAEHGVLPPNRVLSAEIETLPEAFRRAGFRTAGHSEGGFVAGYLGFQRGFEEWSDTPYSAESDVARTLGRGLAFLRGLGPQERFFLFLHTYSVHDPYDPPEPYRAQFWSGPPVAGPPPTGETLSAVNLGLAEVSPETARYFTALYDAGIRYLDEQLRRFFAELRALGLDRETTIVLTSDHGEEFLDHGRLGHSQTYRENLEVPLLLLHPGQNRGERVRSLVELTDIAPTLVELAGLAGLAGIAGPQGMSGRSLAPFLRDPQAPGKGFAFAEVGLGREERSLFLEQDGAVHHLLLLRPRGERDGTWITKEVTFDCEGASVELAALSYRSPRRVEVAVDGRPLPALELTGGWQRFSLTLPPGDGVRRITLGAPDCESPLLLGLGSDVRCLSFKLRGPRLERRELYRVDQDPAERRDRARAQPELLRELDRRLGELHFKLAAPPAAGVHSPEQEQALRALGYLR